MNPEQPDRPDLTAYALGELPPGQEREMREWIASDPGAQIELARIEAISEALHHGAAIPMAKLTLQQRQNVLTPPRGPRIMTPMMPRQPVARREPRMMPFVLGVAKVAAAITLAAGGYMLGRHIQAPASPDVAKSDAPKSTPTPQKPVDLAPLKSVPVRPHANAEMVAEFPTPAPASLVAAVEKQPSPAAAAPATPVPQPMVATSSTPATVETPKVTPAAPAAATIAPEAKGYATVNRDPVARITVRPYETRPAPVKLKGDVLASPMTPAGPAAKSPANDKGRAPELYIQSWKAEVATCPWSPAHKLMRVLLQLPADQPASVSPANTYPMQISFDKLAVRNYRLLSESHVPPHAGTATAAHVVWYEIVPNGNEAIREAGRSVASVTVPGARFNSQTVGPFDGSKLQVLDRGVKWENAREDFLFETSIVGFGLLLRGEENLGALNHELVLKIARMAAGDKAPDGERAKFIRLVQEAKRVTGI